ncbi:hypothetical protein ACU8L2_04010 [Rhizobium leguminosarum]
MVKAPAENIATAPSFQKLEVLETNMRKHDALTRELEAALKARYAQLGRALVSQRTGLELEGISPAEEKIVEAVAKYVGLQKRDGKTANRTFQMLANRGLIEAAEVSVSKSKPTQGFEVLEDADLAELSFEQIIVDYPEEFSPRALWYARKTLGLVNDSEKPPVSGKLITQIRTETILEWMRRRAADRGGNLIGYSNADVGAVLGFADLSIHGRVLGNITSRIDFACYRCGLPPLGLVANTSFANAWSREGRSWSFPIGEMTQAARSMRWTDEDLKRVLARTQELPGTASIPWKQELRDNENAIRFWAFSFKAAGQTNIGEQEPDPFAGEIATVAGLERQALGETPVARQKISRIIERGTIGAAVKRANGYKCQICAAQNAHPYSFLKKNGIPYVEAHHVTPVSEMQIGSLAASNIMTLCANHHRQMHYGDVNVEIGATTFNLLLDGEPLCLERCSLTAVLVQ